MVSALFIVESLLCRRGSVVLGSVLLDEPALSCGGGEGRVLQCDSLGLCLSSDST